MALGSSSYSFGLAPVVVCDYPIALFWTFAVSSSSCSLSEFSSPSSNQLHTCLFLPLIRPWTILAFALAVAGFESALPSHPLNLKASELRLFACRLVHRASLHILLSLHRAPATFEHQSSMPLRPRPVTLTNIRRAEQTKRRIISYQELAHDLRDT